MTRLAQPSLRWLMLSILAACAMTTTALALEAPSTEAAQAEPVAGPLRDLLPPSDDPTAMVEYNLETGEVRRVPSTNPSQRRGLDDALRIEPYVPDLLPEGPERSDEESVIGGDGRARITATTEFPWRSIVKVYFRIANVDYMCSGTFVDEDHVLTAGHCLYDKDANGGAGAWATDVWIVPGMNNGWDTDGYSDRSLKNGPYGAARAIDGRTYTAWTDSEDPDHDWAVLTLDRPVGSFTGWMGRTTMAPAHANYGWYTDTLNSAGYPGDRDNGRNLYFDSDTGCSVSDTRHFYTMDTGGGQSGMPIWRRDATEGSVNRYILSVHAYGVGGSDCGNGATRLNQDKYDRINTWRNADAAAPTRPDLFQLLPDDALKSAPHRTVSSISDRKLSVAEAFSITTTLRNAGPMTTGTFYVNFYLSTNSIISTSDRFIGSVAVSSVGAFTNRDVTLSTTLAANVSAGTYYVGWIIDPDARVIEYDETDNTVLMRQDSAPVTLLVDRALPAAPQPNDGVDGWSTLTSRTFTWPTVNDANGISTYQWRLDGGPETSIGNVTALTLSGLATGVHNFSLRAVDGAGNVGPWGWHLASVDAPPPGRPFALGPEGWTSDTTPRIHLGAPDDEGSGLAGYEYRFAHVGGGYSDVGLVTHFDLPTLATGTWTAQVRAYDGVGQRSTIREVVANVDATAPLTPVLTAAPAAWSSTGSAAFSWTGGDANSGIARYEYRIRAGLEWQSNGALTTLDARNLPEGQHLLQLRAIDNAGVISATTERAFGIDATPPSAPTFVTAPDTWTNDAVVTLRWNAATDALSGVARYDHRFAGQDTWTSAGNALQVELDPLEEGDHTVEVRAVDNAGNPSSIVQTTFHVDLTPPDLTTNLTPATNANGWHRVSARFNASASDAFSGLASFTCTYNGNPFSCGANTWFTSTRVYQVRAVAVDLAGNEAVWEQAVRVDKLAPTLYANFTPSAPNGAGWYNTSVTMEVGAGDAISGVDSVVCRQNGVAFGCSSPITFTDTLGSSLAFLVTDRAGNTATGARMLRIDTGLPEVIIGLDPATPSGTNGWHNGSVTVAVTASDEASGLASLACTRNATDFDCSQPLVLGEGHHGITVVAVDRAGNRRETTRELRIDLAAPTLAVNLSPASPNGDNGWYTTSVKFNASATGGLSGLASLVCTQNDNDYECTRDTWFTATRIQLIRVVATDGAGNAATSTQELKIDKANPVCGIQLGGATNGAGQYVGSATGYLNATDVGSGVGLVEHKVNTGAKTAYTQPLLFGPGSYTLTCYATDVAGRTHTIPRSFAVV